MSATKAKSPFRTGMHSPPASAAVGTAVRLASPSARPPAVPQARGTVFVENKVDTLILRDGTNFRRVSVNSLRGCDVLLLDPCSEVELERLEDCRVFVGACSGTVFLRSCDRCVFTVAADGVRVRDSDQCVLSLHVREETLLENATNIAIGSFNGSYSRMREHWRAAGLLGSDGSGAVAGGALPRVRDAGEEVGRNLPPSARRWRAMGDAGSPAEWMEEAPGGRRLLGSVARLVISSLLAHFDADGDGAWTYEELNAFQAATGDPDRLPDAGALEDLMGSHGIPLDARSRLRFPGLLALYEMQGAEALHRDVEAAGLAPALLARAPGSGGLLVPVWTISAAALARGADHDDESGGHSPAVVRERRGGPVGRMADAETQQDVESPDDDGDEERGEEDEDDDDGYGDDDGQVVEQPTHAPSSFSAPADAFPPPAPAPPLAAWVGTFNMAETGDADKDVLGRLRAAAAAAASRARSQEDGGASAAPRPSDKIPALLAWALQEGMAAAAVEIQQEGDGARLSPDALHARALKRVENTVAGFDSGRLEARFGGRHAEVGSSDAGVAIVGDLARALAKVVTSASQGSIPPSLASFASGEADGIDADGLPTSFSGYLDAAAAEATATGGGEEEEGEGEGDGAALLLPPLRVACALASVALGKLSSGGRQVVNYGFLLSQAGKVDLGARTGGAASCPDGFPRAHGPSPSSAAAPASSGTASAGELPSGVYAKARPAALSPAGPGPRQSRPREVAAAATWADEPTGTTPRKGTGKSTKRTVASPQAATAAQRAPPAPPAALLSPARGVDHSGGAPTTPSPVATAGRSSPLPRGDATATAAAASPPPRALVRSPVKEEEARLVAASSRLLGDLPIVGGHQLVVAARASPGVDDGCDSGASSRRSSVASELSGTTADGVAGTSATAVRGRRESLGEAKKRREAERVRMGADGDVAGLADLFAAELADAVQRAPDIYGRLRKGIRDAEGFVVASAAASSSSPSRFLHVASFAASMSTVGLRWPLPAIACYLARLEGTIVAASDVLPAGLSAPPASGPAARVLVPKSVLERTLSELRRAGRRTTEGAVREQGDGGSAGAAPAPARASALAPRPRELPLDRRIRLVKLALASARDGVPRDLATNPPLGGWIGEDDVDEVLADFDIVPEVWARAEADAEADKWLGSKQGASSLHAEEAHILKASAEAGTPAHMLVTEGGVPHPAVRAEARARVLARRVGELVADMADSPDTAKRLFWTYVKDARSGKWPAPLPSLEAGAGAQHQQQPAPLPTSAGVDRYPLGFEAWLRWREASRRASARAVAAWKRDKDLEAAASRAAGSEVAPLQDVRALVESIAARSVHADGGEGPEGGPGHHAGRRSSRAGLAVEARFARLQASAADDGAARLGESAAAAASARSRSGSFAEGIGGSRRGSMASLGRQSVGGGSSVVDLSSRRPPPALVTRAAFEREFGPALFSLRADASSGRMARAVFGARAEARRRVLSLLHDTGADGEAVRLRLQDLEAVVRGEMDTAPGEDGHGHGGRAGAPSTHHDTDGASSVGGGSLASTVNEDDVRAVAVQMLIEEEARRALEAVGGEDAFPFTQDAEAAATAALAAEEQRRGMTEEAYRAWQQKKDAEHRARKEREQREAAEKEAAAQERRREAHLAYEAWARSARAQTLVPGSPAAAHSSYAHELWREHGSPASSARVLRGRGRGDDGREDYLDGGGGVEAPLFSPARPSSSDYGRGAYEAAAAGPGSSRRTKPRPPTANTTPAASGRSRIFPTPPPEADGVDTGVSRGRRRRTSPQSSSVAGGASGHVPGRAIHVAQQALALVRSGEEVAGPYTEGARSTLLRAVDVVTEVAAVLARKLEESREEGAAAGAAAARAAVATLSPARTAAAAAAAASQGGDRRRRPGHTDAGVGGEAAQTSIPAASGPLAETLRDALGAKLADAQGGSRGAGRVGKGAQPAATQQPPKLGKGPTSALPASIPAAGILRKALGAELDAARSARGDGGESRSRSGSRSGSVSVAAPAATAANPPQPPPRHGKGTISAAPASIPAAGILRKALGAELDAARSARGDGGESGSRSGSRSGSVSVAAPAATAANPPQPPPRHEKGTISAAPASIPAAGILRKALGAELDAARSARGDGGESGSRSRSGSGSAPAVGSRGESAGTGVGSSRIPASGLLKAALGDELASVRQHGGDRIDHNNNDGDDDDEAEREMMSGGRQQGRGSGHHVAAAYPDSNEDGEAEGPVDGSRLPPNLQAVRKVLAERLYVAQHGDGEEGDNEEVDDGESPTGFDRVQRLESLSGTRGHATGPLRAHSDESGDYSHHRGGVVVDDDDMVPTHAEPDDDIDAAPSSPHPHPHHRPGSHAGPAVTAGTGGDELPLWMPAGAIHRRRSSASHVRSPVREKRPPYQPDVFLSQAYDPEESALALGLPPPSSSSSLPHSRGHSASRGSSRGSSVNASFAAGASTASSLPGRASPSRASASPYRPRAAAPPKPPAASAAAMGATVRGGRPASSGGSPRQQQHREQQQQQQQHMEQRRWGSEDGGAEEDEYAYERRDVDEQSWAGESSPEAVWPSRRGGDGGGGGGLLATARIERLKREATAAGEAAAELKRRYGVGSYGAGAHASGAGLTARAVGKGMGVRGGRK
jgi:hypothetical protein